jgi:ubiquinone biosynthesis protein
MLTGKGPLLFEFPILGVVGFVIAGFLGLFLVLSVLRTGKF